MSSFFRNRTLLRHHKTELDELEKSFFEAISNKKADLAWQALRELFIGFQLSHEQAFFAIEQLSPRHKSSTRVLVELGKDDPEIVLPAFDYAVQSNQTDLQWTAILELCEVSRNQPKPFLPLLERGLESDDEHVQWITVLSLLELAKIYPDSVLPRLKSVLNEISFPQDSGIRVPNHVPMENLEKKLARLKSVLFSKNSKTQWNAILELIELAKQYPIQVSPILQQAADSNNPHIQWIALLTLTSLKEKLAAQKDSTSSPILAVYHANDMRILVELGLTDMAAKVQHLFKHALHTNDQNLRLATIYEMAEVKKKEAQTLFPSFQKLLYEQQLDIFFNSARLLIKLAKNNPSLVIKFLQQSSKKKAIQSNHSTDEELTEYISILNSVVPQIS